MTTRILLVDDHAVVRSVLRMLLENERDVEIIGEAASAHEAIEAAVALRPNVILMDIGLPDSPDQFFDVRDAVFFHVSPDAFDDRNRASGIDKIGRADRNRGRAGKDEFERI